MRKLVLVLISFLFIGVSYAENLSKEDTSKAWNCVGVYMANYFLPSGEIFEYGMKEKSMASVKVWKEYALEIGIEEKVWDEGVNKAVDKYFGSKYNEELTENCHTFLERTIPNGKEKVKKVAQTLY
tara:strand:+ start:7153 stop:7530 length:378 start_codon:yes stop_codon:yes gene_type:complete